MLVNKEKKNINSIQFICFVLQNEKIQQYM